MSISCIIVEDEKIASTYLQQCCKKINQLQLEETFDNAENALQYLARDASPWLRVRTNACLSGMRSGLNVGDALAKSGYGFPDVEIIDDLGVYSKLSGFDAAAALLGKEWIVESVTRIQAMMKIIFGISVLSVGLFIAFMVGGLIGMELQMASIMQSSYK